MERRGWLAVESSENGNRTDAGRSAPLRLICGSDKGAMPATQMRMGAEHATPREDGRNESIGVSQRIDMDREGGNRSRRPEPLPPDAESHYVPTLLARQPKLFSPGMLQLISKSERVFVRMDEKIGNGRYAEPIRSMLLNIETLASAVMDGAPIDLAVLLAHDIRKILESGDLPTRLFDESCSRALRYRDFLELNNSCSEVSDKPLNLDVIMSLREGLDCHPGTRLDRRYRNADPEGIRSFQDGVPSPSTLPHVHIKKYMDDLLAFCNTDYYTPLIQATIAHFQMEFIRPFESRSSALGRHLSYLVYAKRNFSRNVIVTTAAETLHGIDGGKDVFRDGRNGKPGRNPLEAWICRSASMMMHQADSVLELEKSFASIERRWRKKMSPIRRDDICSILLNRLLAHPVVSARYIAETTGRTLPTSNEAIRKLVSRGILTQIDNRKRNRCFWPLDVVALYRRAIDDMTPRGD